jgi:hypothetical protein
MSHLNLNIYKYIVGIDEVNNATLSLEGALVDNQRIEYCYSHLRYLWRAIKYVLNNELKSTTVLLFELLAIQVTNVRIFFLKFTYPYKSWVAHFLLGQVNPIKRSLSHLLSELLKIWIPFNNNSLLLSNLGGFDSFLFWEQERCKH